VYTRDTTLWQSSICHPLISRTPFYRPYVLRFRFRITFLSSLSFRKSTLLVILGLTDIPINVDREENSMANQKYLHLQNLCLTRNILVSLYGLCSFLSAAQAYIIHVDAGIENECFHERVPVGVKLGFSFEVIEGGFYDIDVEIKDPNNVILHQDERSSNGKFTIEANLDGPYQFCFSNKKSSHTPKLIIFDIDRSDSVKTSSSSPDGAKPDDETTKLTSMVESLTLATISSRHDVRYLLARDRVHRKINEGTNSRIVWWSGVEFILLLFVTLGQVWYLKRFFEIRRRT